MKITKYKYKGEIQGDWAKIATVWSCKMYAEIWDATYHGRDTHHSLGPRKLTTFLLKQKIKV